MSVRTRVIEAEARSIDASQQRAIEARAAERKPRNALEAVASRLQMTPASLKSTLMQTVFKDCRNDSEFAALIVVANEYGLNPLTKEIYAFPAKGGGVVPMVSIDGWIKLMNSHPQFDGIEFEYTLDSKSGKTQAIEAMIYRRDRSRPIKVMEWMEECERPTDPWRKSPRRMLRHRALIQGVRVAFGFSGIAAEGDEDVIEGEYRSSPSLAAQRATSSLAEELGDEIPSFDKPAADTGPRDSRGMTEVDEGTARQLDAAQAASHDPELDGEEDGWGSAAAQTVSDIDGPLDIATAGDSEEPMWMAAVRAAKAGIEAASTLKALKAQETQWLKARAGVPDEAAQREVDRMLHERGRELRNMEG